MRERTQTQILLFFTTDPDTVMGRIRRFRTAFMQFGQGFDFALVSFLPNQASSVQQKMLDGVAIPHHIYGPDAIDTFRYPVKGSRKPFRLIPGNCDLVPLLFWKAHPQYQQLWVMEDDVEYTGDPARLFADLASKCEDLLASHVTRCVDNWIYTKRFCSPGIDLPADARWLSFFPFYRVSRRALEAIDRRYLEGWDGHQEMTWPTILTLAGCSILDIGGQGPCVAVENINKHYIGLPGGAFEKQGSFGTMHIRLKPGKQKNVLWHPVKTPKAWVKQQAKRTLSIIKWKCMQLTGR